MSEELATDQEPDAEEVPPDPIMETAFGYSRAKVLLTATELDLFTELADGGLTREEIEDRIGLHPRSSADFLDALVAMDFLEREDGRYRNTPVTGKYLVEGRPEYLGDSLKHASDRLYPAWDRLTEAVLTGEPQSELADGVDTFEELYADEDKRAQFLRAMSATGRPTGQALAEQFPFEEYDSVCDLGAAEGAVPVEIARAHDHLEVIGLDLPKVRDHFEEYVAEQGVEDRVRFHEADFFEDPLPEADVYVMGYVLHDWGLEDKQFLIEKAHDALPEDGALIVYGNIIDDERREHASGLIMSLNMLIETDEGFDYTRGEAVEWLREAGFEEFEHEPTRGTESMLVAYK